MKTIPALFVAISVSSTVGAIAQGCCGGGSGAQAGCTMDHSAMAEGHAGHAGHASAQTSTPGVPTPAPVKVFAEPVQALYDNYITVQCALAQDSLEGVAAAAAAMGKAIEGDATKALPATLAQEAGSLAKAQDLAAAREAFKSLSTSLIQHMQAQKIPSDTYYVAYCPMAKASWLQMGKTVMNPYMGTAMVHCGQLKT